LLLPHRFPHYPPPHSPTSVLSFSRFVACFGTLPAMAPPHHSQTCQPDTGPDPSTHHGGEGSGPGDGAKVIRSHFGAGPWLAKSSRWLRATG
jgi:hypothetical protein